MLFSTKSEFGSFFLAVVVSLAIIDRFSSLEGFGRNFGFDLPTDRSVHSKLTEQEGAITLDSVCRKHQRRMVVYYVLWRNP